MPRFIAYLLSGGALEGTRKVSEECLRLMKVRFLSGSVLSTRGQEGGKLD